VHAVVLAEELRVSRQKLNVDVFRARRLFVEHGVEDGAAIVERRPTRARCGGTHAILVSQPVFATESALRERASSSVASETRVRMTKSNSGTVTLKFQRCINRGS
jgi:hypothetical protein